MDITAARYLEYMIHGFYDGLITLMGSESLSGQTGRLARRTQANHI